MARAKPFVIRMPPMPNFVRTPADRRKLDKLQRHIDAVKAMKLSCRKGKKKIQFKKLSTKFNIPESQLRYSARDLTTSLQRLKVKQDLIATSTLSTTRTAVSLHDIVRDSPQALSLRSVQRYCKAPRRRRIDLAKSREAMALWMWIFRKGVKEYRKLYKG